MVIVDFSFPRYSDAIILLEMSPPEPVGGHSIEFAVYKRIGPDSSGLIVKSVASGFNGASGITITDSGIGVMETNINSQDTSGLQAGNYEFTFNRLDSGLSTALAMGSIILLHR